MKSVLVGNGVIIQFGGAEYLNANIIRRAIDNIQSGNFPSHLYPKECLDFLYALKREHRAAVNGNYDGYVFTSFDRASLADFKSRYDPKREYSVTEIGFEDFFLLFELVHYKLGIGNPERFNSRGLMRRMFLDSIFNGGNIESCHVAFPARFVSWLKDHDHVFTTNYDSNIDVATESHVHHLHGSFNVLSAPYDSESFQNQLKDDLLNGEVMDKNYPHLYSTCLVSYVGDLKIFAMEQPSLANRAVEKFAAGYQNDPAIKKQIDDLPEDNHLVRRLKEAVRLKAKQPALEYEEPYQHGLLKEISGSLAFVGLSPNNDRGHLKNG